MKLTTITHVSLDGVMQGLGGADEDRSGGFERGGWAIPLFNDEAEAFLVEVFGRADAFLLGRKTYDIFAGSWGTGSWGADQGNNPISVALNTKPKYVASSTLTEPEWDDTTVLSDDVAAAIGELKAKPGRRAAGARQRRPDPVAARQRPRRRDQPVHLSRGRRPGHAAVPRHRPGQGARADRIADHAGRGDHPGLPARRGARSTQRRTGR